MESVQTKDGNRKLRSSYASAIISVALVLFMLGLLGLLVLDAKKISDYVREHVQLTVYLNENLPQADIDRFTREILVQKYAREVRYISKEAAMDSLKKDLGESAVSMLDVNPLPATIDVNVKANYAHPDSLRIIKEELSTNKMVRDVIYQQTEIKSLNENFRTLALVILVFCGLLLFIAIVLINNTIRLALYSKRFLIKSMQLVGATKGFIRKPFLRRSLAHGIYAGIICLLLLSGIIYLIERQFPELNQLADFKILGILCGGILLFGMVLSGISTFFAVNRYLRLHVDELY
jgi:cell division transport system permease protein